MTRSSAGAVLLALGVLAFTLAACSRGGEQPTTTAAVSTTSTSTTTVPRPPPPPATTTSSTPSVAAPGMEPGEQLPGEPLWALVPGNDPDADRINLVIAPWGWDEFDEFATMAEQLLSWGGTALLVDDGGAITTDPSAAVAAQLGVFAIEPWRSSQDKFNVWITDVEPETPVAWLNEGEAPFDLPDHSALVLALDAHRFNPELTSVAGLEVHFTGPEPPTRPLTGNPFANLVVVVDSAFPAAGLIDVPHELGHALFNLADEYVGQQFGFDGRSDLSSWPSCAEDLDEADDWWGSLIGDVDPMADIWADEMERAGFPIPDTEEVAAAVAVSHVDGGCYGVGGSVRATFDSLMNSSIPVLGSVNRRWAESILALWEGAPR